MQPGWPTRPTRLSARHFIYRGLGCRLPVHDGPRLEPFWCCQLAWAMCGPFVVDGSRLYVPFVRDNWPLKNILREKEQHQLTAHVYGLGAWRSTCSRRLLPVAGSAFWSSATWPRLLLALRAAGRSTIKLGREGKKSLEGSLAMCLACMFIGNLLFMGLPLREYAVTIGAVVATVVGCTSHLV